ERDGVQAWRERREEIASVSLRHRGLLADKRRRSDDYGNARQHGALDIGDESGQTALTRLCGGADRHQRQDENESRCRSQTRHGELLVDSGPTTLESALVYRSNDYLIPSTR